MSIKIPIKAQFTLVTLFASKNGNITVVGDNDQGIYSFRERKSSKCAVIKTQ